MGTESSLRRRANGLSEAAFFQLRCSRDWGCPACGHGRCAALKCRAVYQYNRCKHQVGLTGGTAFHWTKLPLTRWFLAIYHLSQGKGGMSSVELARRLGTRQPTVWLLKHRFMVAMAARYDGKLRLAGRVEVDDAHLGGARSGSKRRPWCRRPDAVRGRGGDHAERKPRRLRLTVVEGFRKREIERLAKRDFAAGTNILTDGLSCWTVVAVAGCTHFPMVADSGSKSAKLVPFTWINTTLGNIRTAVAGSGYHVSGRHAQRYLSSFAWRFNRRYQLDALIQCHVYPCAHAAPHPYRAIRAG